ncbi:MAG: LacI family transcriptional regulator, partial [Paenibacillus sp.]|nr:LacI family transcriptional regulator [Paenibacillus sp.]
IAHIGNSNMLSRELGYRNELMLNGVEVNDNLIVKGMPCYEFGFVSARKLVENGESFSAMFCFNDSTALGAIRGIESQGLRVPEDVAVVGFDDIQMASLSTPSLTTVRQPLKDMGKSAVERLLSLLADGSASLGNVVFSTELVVRGSCGAHKHAEK